MDQEIIKPDTTPKGSTQALSPLGGFVAAAGATLMIFCMTGSAMTATVWAFCKLLGLPDMVLYALLAVGLVPVLWATAWTAGRARHVEQLIATNRDIDAPVFKLGHYLRKG